MFDRNWDGYVDARELKKVTTTLGQQLSPEELEAFMHEADMDGDGKLNYEEFVKMMLCKDWIKSHEIFYLPQRRRNFTLWKNAGGWSATFFFDSSFQLFEFNGITKTREKRMRAKRNRSSSCLAVFVQLDSQFNVLRLLFVAFYQLLRCKSVKWSNFIRNHP